MSLSGGGIRGLLSARLLDHLMTQVGASVSDTFHMVAGTSTGALIGMTQVRPGALPLSQLPGLYRELGPVIFQRPPRWRLRAPWGLRAPKYPLDGLKHGARELAGDHWLSDCVIDFLVAAYDLGAGDAHWFRSWDAKSRRDFALADVGHASASAPTYFPAAKIIARDRSTHHFVDGGLFANNPSLKAVQEARRLYPQADEIMLVSIGTGTWEPELNAERAANWGLIRWISPLIEILREVNEDHLQEIVETAMHGHPYYHFDIDISLKRPGLRRPDRAMDLTSQENLNRLDALADAWIEETEPSLHALAKQLKQPKQSQEALGRKSPPLS